MSSDHTSSVLVRHLTSPRASERGAILIIVAVLLVVLIGFAGLAIDSGRVNLATEQLQGAADAAAMAGSRVLKSEINPSDASNPFTNTRAAAVSIASGNSAAAAPVQLDLNTANAADGDIVIGAWDGSTNAFTPNLTAPNAVKVTARRTAGSAGGALDLFFGPAFGVSTSDVSRTGISVVQGSSNPYLLVLNATASDALAMVGRGNLDASPGNVQVNSTSSSAIDITGSARLSAGAITTAGAASYPGGSITGSLVEHGSTITDPLSGVLPDTAAWNALKAGMPQPLGATGKISSGGTFSPGYYPKGLATTSSNAVTLSPGVYMFGTKFNTLGTSTVTGDGVTIFLDQGAELGMAGGTNLILKPPTSGSYRGITLFSHRGNTSTTAVNLNGGGTIDIEGTLYVPGGTLSMTGTTMQKVGQLICNKFSMSGTGQLTGKNVIPPAGPSTVYLVH